MSAAGFFPLMEQQRMLSALSRMKRSQQQHANDLLEPLAAASKTASNPASMMATEEQDILHDHYTTSPLLQELANLAGRNKYLYNPIVGLPTAAAAAGAAAAAASVLPQKWGVFCPAAAAASVKPELGGPGNPDVPFGLLFSDISSQIADFRHPLHYRASALPERKRTKDYTSFLMPDQND